MTHQEAILAMLQIEGLGPVHLRQLLEHFDYDPRRVWQASLADLGQVAGMGTRWIAGMDKVDWSKGTRECQQCQARNIALLCYHTTAYPRLLLPLRDPPILLYAAGTLLPQDDLAVAIVGTRQASKYGVRIAYHLAQELAQHGITVVSGLARGIDTAAHQGALAGGGRTIAVLGHGLDTIYPPDNTELAQQIATRGALVSEFPLAAPPLSPHFPRRNRIISGMSLGVIVVEGSKDSGALITVDSALEQGREVFAVPGEIGRAQSEGPHFLIQQGAKLVTSLDDVLEEIPALAEKFQRKVDAAAGGDLFATLAPENDDVPARTSAAAAATPPLNELEKSIWQALADEPQPIEIIVQKSKLGVSVVNSCLLQMELRKLVQMSPGLGYSRA